MTARRRASSSKSHIGIEKDKFRVHAPAEPVASRQTACRSSRPEPVFLVISRTFAMSRRIRFRRSRLYRPGFRRPARTGRRGLLRSQHRIQQRTNPQGFIERGSGRRQPSGIATVQLQRCWSRSLPSAMRTAIAEPCRKKAD